MQRRMLAHLIVGLLFSMGAITGRAADPDESTVSTTRTDLPHVVMLVAEREYETLQSLQAFSGEHLRSRYRVTVLQPTAEDRNRFEGIEAVEQADVLLVSVRRRTLPKSQLDLIRRYVSAGKPVLGIRTANHAFCLRNQSAPDGLADWPSWDRDVFGGSYTNHYGNDLQTTLQLQSIDDDAKQLLTGITTAPTTAGGSLYRVSPVAAGASICMLGKVDGHPAEPVAWSYRRVDGGWSFYTSLGHVDDFAGPVLPQLLVNALARATSEQE